MPRQKLIHDSRFYRMFTGLVFSLALQKLCESRVKIKKLGEKFVVSYKIIGSCGDMTGILAELRLRIVGLYCICDQMLCLRTVTQSPNIRYSALNAWTGN